MLIFDCIHKLVTSAITGRSRGKANCNQDTFMGIEFIFNERERMINGLKIEIRRYSTGGTFLTFKIY